MDPDANMYVTFEELRQACTQCSEEEILEWWQNQCIADADGEFIVYSGLKGKRVNLATVIDSCSVEALPKTLVWAYASEAQWHGWGKR